MVKKNADQINGKKKNDIIRTIKEADNSTIVLDEMKKVNVSYFEIDVVKKTQKGTDYFSGEMDLHQLSVLTHVDNYNGKQADVPGKGQRALNESRGRQFMNFIADRDNVCFMEILLNDRDGEFAEFTSLQQMGIRIKQHSKLAATHGIIRLPSNAKLYVYDGQTRRFGYLSLLHFDLEMLGTEAYKDYKHLKIPFCLCQVSPTEETKLFLQHNKQTSVPNDHKAIVTYHAHKDQVDIRNHTYTEKMRSIVAGMTFMMNNDRTNPFYKNIAMPDLSKAENKERFATQGSFNTGLKQFIGWLNRNYWSPETLYREKSEDLADICTIFWKSVKKTCPKIWRKPEDYIQLKSHGVSTLSLLMHTLYVDFHDRNLEWNILNIHNFLKKSKIMITPKKWEIGGELQKRGGNYKALENVQRDIYAQIRKG